MPGKNQAKIEKAIERLEANLPIRRNQTQLPAPLRQLHQWILHFYLRQGKAPDISELNITGSQISDLEQLAAQHIIVLDDNGKITGAYPFVNEARDFKVTSQYGTAFAMCAFDALAISSMFDLPVRIESHCHISGKQIVIEQHGDQIYTTEPVEPVFAAINWAAASGADTCSATLCCEMIFISGKSHAQRWQSQSADSRELFDLSEAHAFISAVFVSLMNDVYPAG